MLLLLLFLAETSALTCNKLHADEITVTDSVKPAVIPEDWSSPPAEGMECVRGYSSCLAPGSRSTGCTFEYSITDLEACTSSSARVLAPEDTTGTLPRGPAATNTRPGLAIDEQSTVRDHEENFDEELWNNVLTPRDGCAKQFIFFPCASQRTDCSRGNYMDNVSHHLEVYQESVGCNGFFVNTVILDIDQPIYNTPFPKEKKGKIFGGKALRERTVSSVTFAWSTLLPNNRCIAAYNMCWKKPSTALVGCRRNAKNSFSRIITDEFAENINYQGELDLLEGNVIITKPGKVTFTKPGAATHIRDSLITVTTMLIILELWAQYSS